uniref:Uncharacterized protein n=1 Tax=Astyanax mexicanus TaxID=7994 RepID=A0A8B9RHN7_ASTMX
MGSPQVRPASSGPPFATAANGTPPQQPLQQSPLKQMAAQQQQRAKLIQQKQQSQAASWSPAGAPTSPYGGPFNPDKPNSPMMYPQAFNAPSSMVPKPGMNNYLQQQQQQQQQQSVNLAAQNALNKQLSYSNTKPLSHFSAVDHMNQRMTPPMASQAKNPMLPYMQGAGGQGGGPPPAQGPIPGQTAHLTEEQKRMMMMKQKVLGQGLPYSAMQQHAQVRCWLAFCYSNSRVCRTGVFFDHGWEPLVFDLLEPQEDNGQPLVLSIAAEYGLGFCLLVKFAKSYPTYQGWDPFIF